MDTICHSPPTVTDVGNEQLEWRSTQHLSPNVGGAAGHSISPTAEITDARGAPAPVPLL